MTRLALILTTAALPVLAAGSAVACDKAVKQTAQIVPASAVTYQAMLPAAVASSVEMNTPPTSDDEDGEVMSDSDTTTDYGLETESAVTTTPNSEVAGDVEIYEPGLETVDDGLTGENSDTLSDDDADVSWDSDAEASDEETESDDDEAQTEEPLFAPED